MAKSNIDKLANRIRKNFWEAQEEFELIEPEDKVLVCLSGGKDSYTMLDVLMEVQKVIGFDLVAMNLDQKQPGFPEHVLPEYLEKLGVEYQIVEKNTYKVVIDKIEEGKTMCSLCSRLRRGTIYGFAEEIGATKIALGHHREDLLETFFMNLFFNGKIETMPAKYKTDDGKHIVIRPLAFAKEEEIAKYAKLKEFPIIPCNLCGSQPKMQRQIVKKMIKEWEKEYPRRTQVMFAALKNIHASHMLDKSLFDFGSITAFDKVIQKSEI